MYNEPYRVEDDDSYVFTTKQQLQTALVLWASASTSDRASALATYGNIATWNVSAVTDMSYIFCSWVSGPWQCSHPISDTFNDDISGWDARRSASESTALRYEGFR